MASLAVGAALIALAIIVMFVPIAARERGAALGLATIAYFSGVHSRRSPDSRLGWLPIPGKILDRIPFNQVGNELLVATIFICGCMLPVWPRAVLLPAPLWPLALVAAYFMLLAWLNYHAIGRWEAGDSATHIPAAAFLLAGTGIAVAVLLHASHPAATILIGLGSGSALLLALLNQNRRTLTPLALRASADLVLVLPLIGLALRP